MQLIRLVDPVAEIERPIGRQGDADRAKIVTADDNWFYHGTKRGSAGLKPVALDAVIAPGGHQQATSVRRGQVVRLVGEHAARGLSGAGNHGQGPGQLAIPGSEWVHAFAAVAESITVIAPFHDVQEPAGRPRVGVVVHREEASELVEGKTEGIPEAGGDTLEFRTVGSAPVYVSPLAAAGKGCPVAALEPIIGSQVLT